MNADGRARIKTIEEKLLLSFETGNSEKKKVWTMAFSVPLRGEELLSLNWGVNPQTISGGLYKRFLRPMMLEGAQHKIVLRKLIKKFSILLTLRIKLHASENKLSCYNDECRYGKTIFVWSQKGDKVFITSKINSKERIVFELSDRKSNTYKRFSFYLENIKKIGSDAKSPFRLDFFISSCHDVVNSDVILLMI